MYRLISKPKSCVNAAGLNLTAIMPDVIVKGGDYTVDEIAGAKEVIANGGKIVINPILDGFSTTAIIKAIK